MKYKWLNKTNSNNLILFFNGWGMDDNIVSHLDFDGYDVLMFYDYNTLSTEFDKPIISNYKSVHLIAWSMGVMIATLFGIKPDSATAISGTLYPIDDEYGIPKKIYELTLRGFSETSIKKFITRMFLVPPKQKIITERDIETQKAELKSLMDYKSNPDFHYTRVIIPSKDLIIPTKNQLNYWQNNEYEEITSGHCPFMLYNKWSELI